METAATKIGNISWSWAISDPVTAFKIVAGREIFTINRETFDSKVLSITPDRLAR